MTLQPFVDCARDDSTPPISWRSIAWGSAVCIPVFWIIHLLLVQWLRIEPSSLGSLTEPWLVPLHATWRPRYSLWVVPALIANAAFLAWVVPLLLRAPSRMTLAVMSFIALSVSTSMMDGYKSRGKEIHASVVLPFSRTNLEYYGDVPLVERTGGPREFIRQFSDERVFRQLSLHSKSHPPGGALSLWVVTRWLGPGLWRASLSVIAFSSLACIFVFLIAREAYGEAAARATLVLFLVTPTIVLNAATSMDAAFAVPPMAALFLFLRAQRLEESWARAVFWGSLSGLAMAVASFMAYATVCLPLVYLVLMVRSARDRARVLRMALSHVAGLLVFAGFYLALFLWADYRPLAAASASIASAGRGGPEHAALARYVIRSLSNLVAFAVAMGLPTLTLWVLKATRRDGDWRRDVLAGSFSSALLLIGFSTLFELEVERIWLLLSPFVLAPAGRWLSDGSVGERGDRSLERFIAALAANTFMAELFLDTPW